MTEPRVELPEEAVDAFGMGEASPLRGGTAQVWRAGDLVVKQIRSGSLEHHDSLRVFPWLADVLSRIETEGFRASVPRRARTGEWLTRGLDGMDLGRWAPAPA
jgi:hypothetical protein